MAEANASLSPKALERIRRLHVAVRTLAQREAKKAVQARIRAEGLKLHQFTVRESALLAEDYLAHHRADLVAQAIEIINTSPEFTRWSLTERQA